LLRKEDPLVKLYVCAYTAATFRLVAVALVLALGAAAGISTLLYLPLKAAFAIGGGIVGGLAYAFSGGNENAAKSIWTTSLYGTYIITPDHLRGDRPIRFLGVPETEASAQAAAPMEPIR
jgi:uncharacterized membrane protein